MSPYNLGLILRHHRTLKAMTIKELAEKVDVTRQTVYYWETGKRIMSLPNIRKVAAALDIDVTTFTQYLH